MTMIVALEDSTYEGIENTANTGQSDRWFSCLPESAEVFEDIFSQNQVEWETGNWVIVPSYKPQAQDKQWFGIEYPRTPIPTGPTIVMRSNIAVGNVVIGGGVVFDNDADVSSGVAFVAVTPVTCDIVFNSNDVYSSSHLISGRIHHAVFLELPPAINSERYIGDIGIPITQQDKSRQVLSDFTSYVQEILERKQIEIIETTIRNWQAIEDPKWKQCILELTIKTESHIALCIWDELAEELNNFISLQPEVIRSSLHDNLSLNVRWV